MAVNRIPLHAVSAKLKTYFPWLRRVVSLAVIGAVVWAAIQAFQQLGGQNLDWSQSRPLWLLAASACYFLAMSAGWLFWHTVLRRMSQRPPLSASFRAFFFSQLAKYIPGKAMVVVVRSATVSGRDVKTGVAAVSVFVETLTWIAIAATISCLVFLFDPQADWTWKVAAVTLFLVTAVPTFPPVFRRVVTKVARNRFGAAADDISRGVTFPTLGIGWIVMSCGWCCSATSLWLVLHALPGPPPAMADWWLCLSVVSLATVIGFASFIPGGFGVRELVMIPLLGASFGSTKALLAAIVLRLVCIVTEVLIASVVYLIHHLHKPKSLRDKPPADSRLAA